MLNIQWFVGEKGLREVTHFTQQQMEVRDFRPDTLLFGFRVDKALHSHPEYLSEHELCRPKAKKGKNFFLCCLMKVVDLHIY